jgi:hypothetical protein
MNRTILTRTIDLGYEQMLVLESHPNMRLRVLYGGVWLTEEGLRADVFAGGGAEVALHTRGRAVVEGLAPTQLQVLEPAPVAAAWAALKGLLLGVAGWLRARIQRAPARTPATC